jgi:YebC/PmpR family DNA-binding regulatory protein
MSGHSKWHSIKHKKGKEDAKRGKIFTKMIKEISVAARMGGGDPTGNPRLRSAIAEAKSYNMPGDNIQRAIKKGTGEAEGVNYEEITYEGYGPAGIAIIVDVLTDNRKRTVSELRYIFSKAGGNLGETGSVSWMFKKCSLFEIPKNLIEEEKLFELVTEAGADDMVVEEDVYRITSLPEKFGDLMKCLEVNNIKPQTAKLSKEASNLVNITDDKSASQVLKIMDTLEDHDDVQNVYANFDIDDDTLSRVESSD